MTVTIFGATGLVGKALVQTALDKGHIVKAFGRNVWTTVFPDNPHLTLIKGYLFDETDVHDAIAGSDAVLSAIGGALDGSDLARSKGMETIIKQMTEAGVSRIIAVGGMGVLDDAAGNFLLNAPGYPQQYVAVGREHLKAFQQLSASTLRWTFVCCPDILPAPATGTYHTAAHTTPAPNNYKIHAGDLAAFIIDELEKNRFIAQRVGISN